MSKIDRAFELLEKINKNIENINNRIDIIEKKTKNTNEGIFRRLNNINHNNQIFHKKLNSIHNELMEVLQNNEETEDEEDEEDEEEEEEEEEEKKEKKEYTLPIFMLKKNDNIGNMLSKIINGEKEEEKVSINYLEDSDDEEDKIATIEDIKYKKSDKKKENKNKIVEISEIIGRNNIKNIDDLIKIGNYYNEIKSKLSENTSNISNKIEKINKKNKKEEIEDLIKSEYEIINSFLGKIPKENSRISITKMIKDKDGNNIKKVKKIYKYDKTKNKMIYTNSDEEEEKEDKINNYELYELGGKYYTLNLEKIGRMMPHLIKLKKMIGLEEIKNEIIDMILYYLMNFEKNNSNMLHMTLEGSPGCGKTKIAKIISKLMTSMGILENDKVIYARRTDLIGSYLGHTGQKTQNIIDKAQGGVLFIDEAYSLGSSKKDIYSKECLDILNQNLSDNKKNFVCIIAGYSSELEEYFFSSNPGLTRRFPFRYKIKEYSSKELCDIFINKIYKMDWKIDEDVEDIYKFFEVNINNFKYFGGDIETFIQDIKYTHSRRVVCQNPDNYKIITNEDIKKAFNKFKKRRDNKNDNFMNGMYI